MRTSTNRHTPVMVARPRTPEGLSIERSSSGLRLVDSVGLSDEVCAVCGYGPTDLQVASRGMPAFHSATPLVELEAQRLFTQWSHPRARTRDEGSAAPPPSGEVGLVIVDARTVRNGDGLAYDVLAAIDALSWHEQLCPVMAHEYAIRSNSPTWAWDVVARMLKADNPESFQAYFRGYQSPSRYWDAPDGKRYWRSRIELDRCAPEDSDVRRTGPGVGPAVDWDTAPWAPEHDPRYELDSKGQWWPTEEALRDGYQPCRACQQTSKKGVIAGRT
jgi:hypothetical protein